MGVTARKRRVPARACTSRRTPQGAVHLQREPASTRKSPGLLPLQRPAVMPASPDGCLLREEAGNCQGFGKLRGRGSCRLPLLC